MCVTKFGRQAAVLVVAATCAGPLAGCISDSATKPVAVAQVSKQNPGNQKSENGQMRYYGGPKSPMWRAE